MSLRLDRLDRFISQADHITVFQCCIHRQIIYRDFFLTIRPVKIPRRSPQLLHQHLCIRPLQNLLAVCAAVYDHLRESPPDIWKCSHMIVMRMSQKRKIQRVPSFLRQLVLDIFYYITAAVSHAAINDRSLLASYDEDRFAAASRRHTVLFSRERESVETIPKHIKYFDIVLHIFLLSFHICAGILMARILRGLYLAYTGCLRLYLKFFRSPRSTTI